MNDEIAETYVLCQEPMLVSAVAAEDCQITFFESVPFIGLQI